METEISAAICPCGSRKTLRFNLLLFVERKLQKFQQNIQPINFWDMIWKFKNYQFESQVASINRLPFVLAAVDRVTNETIAYEKIPLISVLHCNIYLALTFYKILFLFVKSVISTTRAQQ